MKTTKRPARLAPEDRPPKPELKYRCLAHKWNETHQAWWYRGYFTPRGSITRKWGPSCRTQKEAVKWVDEMRGKEERLASAEPVTLNPVSTKPGQGQPC